MLLYLSPHKAEDGFALIFCKEEMETQNNHNPTAQLL